MCPQERTEGCSEPAPVAPLQHRMPHSPVALHRVEHGGQLPWQTLPSLQGLWGPGPCKLSPQTFAVSLGGLQGTETPPRTHSSRTRSSSSRNRASSCAGGGGECSSRKVFSLLSPGRCVKETGRLNGGQSRADVGTRGSAPQARGALEWMWAL